jgi:hypothetical protein
MHLVDFSTHSLVLRGQSRFLVSTSALIFGWILCQFMAAAPCSAQSSTLEGTASRPAAGETKQASEQSTKQPSGTDKENLTPVAAAKSLLALLNNDQLEQAVLPFESSKRVEWHFIPMASRKGLGLMDMDAPQKAAALGLLNSCLSRQGYQKAIAIMNLEKLLKLLEGDGGRMERNSEKYYFTFFGQPVRNELWGLSIEGHHLSLNFVLQGNRIIDSTPQFFAANPAIVKEETGSFPKGLQVLRPEQQLAFQMIQSFSEEQLQAASLPGETPNEIYTAGKPQPTLPHPARGIYASDLTEAQKESLRKLLQAYTSKMKKRVSEQRWSLIEEAGFDQIQFGWSGGRSQGQGHYYVIQGPTFLVEFINVQPDAAGNPANHIHCVWRDMTGDFNLTVR